jgi:hypothetical protein
MPGIAVWLFLTSWRGWGCLCTLCRDLDAVGVGCIVVYASCELEVPLRIVGCGTGWWWSWDEDMMWGSRRDKETRFKVRGHWLNDGTAPPGNDEFPGCMLGGTWGHEDPLRDVVRRVARVMVAYGVVKIELERVVVELTTAQRLQGRVTSLGMSEMVWGGGGTACRSRGTSSTWKEREPRER